MYTKPMNMQHLMCSYCKTVTGVETVVSVTAVSYESLGAEAMTHLCKKGKPNGWL